MDAVPIVPPLFRGTKNTTLHELQTHDRSRATDILCGVSLLSGLHVSKIFALAASARQHFQGAALRPPGRDHVPAERHDFNTKSSWLREIIRCTLHTVWRTPTASRRR